MAEDFGWIELYQEIGRYILKHYKDKPAELIELIKELWPRVTAELVQVLLF